MTPAEFKILMERAWREIDCADPLAPAHWDLGRDRLFNDRYTFVLKHDDRSPRLPQPPI
jgi:hypothetical protein